MMSDRGKLPLKPEITSRTLPGYFLSTPGYFVSTLAVRFAHKWSRSVRNVHKCECITVLGCSISIHPSPPLMISDTYVKAKFT